MLERNDLVQATRYYYVECSNPMSPYFDELSDSQQMCDGESLIEENDRKRGFAVCNKCNRTIDLVPEVEKRGVTVKILKQNLIDWISDTMKPYVDEFCSMHSPFYWKATVDDSEAIVFFADYSPLLTLLTIAASGKGFLTLVWDRYLMQDLQESDCGWNLLSVSCLLEKPKIVKKCLDLALSKTLPNTEYFQSLEKLREFVEIDDPDGSRFEGLVHQFLKELDTRDADINEFLLSIEKVRQVCRWTVALGGPGKPDLIRLDLRKYLTAFFRLRGNVECKSFRVPKFNKNHFNKVIGHSLRTGNPHEALMIISTNDVEAWVWETIERHHRNENRYQYVLITLELFALLISGLGLNHILLEDE